MTQKNIVYGNITATGDVHFGDIVYNIQENFQHSILFLRIDVQEDGLYSAQLSLKSRHAGKAKLPAAGLQLLHENIPLQLSPQLFEQVNAFQEFRRLGDANYRDTPSQFTHLTPWSEEQLTQVLFDAFFQGDILQVCRDFVDLLEKRKIEELILAISSPDTQVLNLPFEMLIPRFFPSKLGVVRQSLAVNHFGLVRSLETELGSFDMQGKTASAAPLKMLFVTALPENLDEKSKMLEIEEEQKRLIDAIGTFEATGGQPKIVIEFLDTASLDEINEALKKHQHDILHISGHGSYKKDVKRGVLHLEDEEGNHLEVSGGTLGETLRQHQCIKLLILSACETAVTGDGVVEELAAYGLPAIVAMRFAVTDEGAKMFTTTLYAALSKGETLTLALAQARESLWQYLQAQVQLDPQHAHLAEWYTPVVYLNQYSAALVDRQLPYVYPEDFYPRSDFFKTKNTRLIGSGFIGRKRYLNQLRRSFAQGQHIVLHGLGGLGKTTLAEAFAHNYDNRSHEVLIFRNGIQISEQYILSSILTRFAKKLPEHLAEQLKAHLESDAEPTEKLQALLDNVLQSRKTILVFDNFEDVQQNAEGEQEQAIGSASLASFMQYFCANTPANCHLLFTTRYVISDLAESVRHLGLDKMSYAESYRLSNFSPTLRAIPLVERQDVFKRLDGHPRAYEFLETILKKDKNTDWSTLAASVGQVEAKVWENLLLEKIYAGLTEAEQRVLQMAAVCFTRTPLGALVVVSGEEETVLMPLLQSLQDWSLCVWDGEFRVFEVHRLTREWMLKNMVDGEDVKKWALGLGSYYSDNANSYEDIELGIVYFGLAEDWLEFVNISFSLEAQYRLIGYNQRAFELSKTVFEKNINESSNAEAYSRQGLVLEIYGELDQALDYFKKSRSLFSRIGDHKGEGAVLNNIGQTYASKGLYDVALSYLQDSLALMQHLSHKSGEATALNNIGLIHIAKGENDRALEYLKNSFTIMKEIGEESAEGSLLNNISQIFKSKGNYNLALEYLELSLDARDRIGDSQGIVSTLNNMATIHMHLKDYDKALNYLNTGLSITREIGNKKSEGTILNNISQIYIAKSDYDKALHFLRQSFDIYRHTGDFAGLATVTNNIGVIYWEHKHDSEQAIGCFRKAYQIFQQIGSPRAEASRQYLIIIILKIGEAQFNAIMAKLDKEEKENFI